MAEIFKHIKSIKGFGIFSDYAHPGATTVPDFQRYNVFYGWNGTGKTTLTRLLRCFETEEIYPDFAAGTFAIERAQGGMAALTHQTLNALSGRVKVFNRDFIEENLDLEIKRGGKAKPVAHVGKENIEKSEKLKAMKVEIKTVGDQKDITKTNVDTKVTALDRLAQAIGSEIKAATQTGRRDKYKNYNKANVKEAYDAGAIKDVTLSTEEFEKLKVSINSENKVDIIFTPPALPDLEALQREVSAILAKEILADETIERLKDNPVIEAWVKEGLGVHNHESGKPCEFCGNPFTAERLTELKRHFSGARQEFLDAVDVKIAAINFHKEVLSAIALPSQAELFSEFVDGFKTATPILNKAGRDIGLYMDRLMAALADKKKSPHTAMVLAGETEENLESISAAFTTPQDEIEAIIAKHNTKVSDFDASIQGDKETIEQHFLNARQAEYRALETEIAALSTVHEEAVAAHTKLEADRDAIATEIQETRIACETINGHLEDYLGHDEIKFEDFEDGYLIKRNGEVAKNLSEGEKTAIAFVYFINTLKDNFDPAASVVVVDDPISSLDANNMHHAFNFMVEHTKNAGQLFVLTHNFAFLRKVKLWFHSAKKYPKPKQEPVESQFFQLSCNLNSSRKRMSRITKLDALLKDHDSEYHFLFKKLMECEVRRQAANDMTYEELYPLVNAGRKALETFLDFKYPARTEKYLQLQEAKVQLTGEFVNERKRDLLWGLLNDGSHADFDTGGFDTFRNNPEVIKRAVEALMDFIEEVDPAHYESLCNCRGITARTKPIAVAEIGLAEAEILSKPDQLKKAGQK